MRMIDPNELSSRMYHEAFEKDSDMQKWEQGCWIRYKVFENCLADTPTIDAEEIRYGEWMPIIEANEFGEAYQSGIYCSECGETLGCEANFCPNCGAKMRIK